MSGFISEKEGAVSLTHYSTSSLIRLTLTSREQNRDGSYSNREDELWLSYSDFDNLKECINKISI